MVFSSLQKVGRSFMLPIAILPVAGLFLGIGQSLTNAAMIESYGLEHILGPGTFLHGFLTVLSQCGEIIFHNLPLLFAVGVAIGMAKGEREVSALSSVIAFLVMHSSIGAMLQITDVSVSLPTGSIISVLGIQSLQMGVFGGILVGLGVAFLHNRFHKIQFIEAFSFFSGSRFVPIISAVVYMFVGILLFYIWPFLQSGIFAIGGVVKRSGYAGTFLYGMIERAAIPFGLHHIFYMPFWQTPVGGTAVIDGTLIEGAQNIFFAQLASPSTTQFSVEATRFMAGKFPFMIFGLPGAAFAMYTTANTKQKKAVSGLLFSAALTSIITGITEPIEFMFLFAAPALYGVHCALAGMSFLLMHLFRVGVGMTFSGGVLDLFLFGILQGNEKTHWIWIIVVGIFYFILYFSVFRFFICHFDLKTPGREVIMEEEETIIGEPEKNWELISAKICQALGGKSNILEIDCCTTRLRCTVEKLDNINEELLKSTGAIGVMKQGKGVQIIYGPWVAVLKAHFMDYLHHEAWQKTKLAEISVPMQNVKIGKKEVFGCPVSGEVKDLSEAPDPAFAGKLMGDGVVIFPTGNRIVAPADGMIILDFPSHHAIGMVTEEGRELLIHVGTDTFQIQDACFHGLVTEGDKVKRGDVLIEFNLESLLKNASSAATPVVFTNLTSMEQIRLAEKTMLQENEDMLWIECLDNEE